MSFPHRPLWGDGEDGEGRVGSPMSSAKKIGQENLGTVRRGPFIFTTFTAKGGKNASKYRISRPMLRAPLYMAEIVSALALDLSVSLATRPKSGNLTS